MIYPSDLDPWCPVCDREVGVDTWSAGLYVAGFCAALKRHHRVTGAPLVRWSDPEPQTEALPVEICPGSGEPPRILPRPIRRSRGA